MSTKGAAKNRAIKEVIVLEELFLDTLSFKFGATMNLYTFEANKRSEIISFVDQLKTITKENIKLLNQL